MDDSSRHHVAGLLETAQRQQARWQWTAARDTLRLAVRVARDAGPPEGIALLTAQRMLAEVLRELGEVREAHQLAVALVPRCAELLGPDHPGTVRTRAVLATITYDLGDLDAAADLCRQVLDSGKGADGPAARAVLLTQATLARLQHARGEDGPALAMLDKAHGTFRRRYGDEDLETLRMAADLAELQVAMGNRPAARQLLTRAHHRARALLGGGHPFTVRLEERLAEVEPPMPSRPEPEPEQEQEQDTRRRRWRRGSRAVGRRVRSASDGTNGPEPARTVATAIDRADPSMVGVPDMPGAASVADIEDGAQSVLDRADAVGEEPAGTGDLAADVAGGAQSMLDHADDAAGAERASIGDLAADAGGVAAAPTIPPPQPHRAPPQPAWVPSAPPPPAWVPPPPPPQPAWVPSAPPLDPDRARPEPAGAPSAPPPEPDPATTGYGWGGRAEENARRPSAPPVRQRARRPRPTRSRPASPHRLGAALRRHRRPLARGLLVLVTAAGVCTAALATPAAVRHLRRTGASSSWRLPASPTTHPVPSHLILRDHGSSITVSWDDPSHGTAAPVVSVSRSGGPGATVVPVPQGATSYTATGLDPSGNYCFLIALLPPGTTSASPTSVCTTRGPGTATPGAEPTR